MITRLQERYRNTIVQEMMKQFNFKSRMQAPKIEKIVINMGVGKANEDIKHLEDAMKDLATITGQKPVITRAKKAVANFKIRKGMPIGCKVTLRKAHMYEFLDRLINVALPRIKDFRGVSGSSFDQHGNYTLGIAEQSIFPEIDIDKIKRVQGMDVIIVIEADNVEQAKELLRHFGMPFRS
ncbi:MAG: 50S ribosomal protein L5 [Candidatus Omnitrophica bacterium]|nr:50S ribosomal protein L5 [Candidatus Omnitrophota bacterium]